MSALMIEEQKLIEQFKYLNLEVKLHRDHISCGRLITTKSSLEESRRSSWRMHHGCVRIRESKRL